MMQPRTSTTVHPGGSNPFGDTTDEKDPPLASFGIGDGEPWSLDILCAHVQQPSYAWKVPWVTITIGMFIVCGYYVSIGVIGFINPETFVRTDLEEPAVKFPTVTICNMNPFKMQALQEMAMGGTGHSGSASPATGSTPPMIPQFTTPMIETRGPLTTPMFETKAAVTATTLSKKITASGSPSTGSATSGSIQTTTCTFTCPTGWTQVQYSGSDHCYIYPPLQNLSFFGYDSYCSSLYPTAHVLTVQSANENSQVLEECRLRYPGIGLWIGAYYQNTSWNWVDNAPWGYNWVVTKTLSPPTINDCVFVENGSSLMSWTYGSCDTYGFATACEMPPIQDCGLTTSEITTQSTSTGPSKSTAALGQTINGATLTATATASAPPVGTATPAGSQTATGAAGTATASTAAPSCVSKCPSGWKTLSIAGKRRCYYFPSSSPNLTFYEYDSYCKGKNPASTILQIQSSDEENATAPFLGDGGVWMGAYYQSKEWHWLDGSTLTWDDFASSVNGSDGECAYTFPSKKWQWYSLPCIATGYQGYPITSACEMDPISNCTTTTAASSAITTVAATGSSTSAKPPATASSSIMRTTPFSKASTSTPCTFPSSLQSTAGVTANLCDETTTVGTTTPTASTTPLTLSTKVQNVTIASFQPTTPCVPKCPSSAWTLLPINGLMHCYFLPVGQPPRTFYDYDAFCKGLSPTSYVASLQSADEENQIRTAIQLLYPAVDIWVGAVFANTWIWSDNTPYNNYKSLDSSATNGYCGFADGTTGAWSYDLCQDPNGVVNKEAACEVPAEECPLTTTTFMLPFSLAPSVSASTSSGPASSSTAQPMSSSISTMLPTPMTKVQTVTAVTQKTTTPCAPKCPLPKWTMLTVNGVSHCYFFPGGQPASSFVDYDTFCKGYPTAYIANIQSAEEEALIKSNLAAYDPTADYWVGAVFMNQWSWSDNSTYDAATAYKAMSGPSTGSYCAYAKQGSPNWEYCPCKSAGTFDKKQGACEMPAEECETASTTTMTTTPALRSTTSSGTSISSILTTTPISASSSTIPSSAASASTTPSSASSSCRLTTPATVKSTAAKTTTTSSTTTSTTTSTSTSTSSSTTSTTTPVTTTSTTTPLATSSTTPSSTTSTSSTTTSTANPTTSAVTSTSSTTGPSTSTATTLIHKTTTAALSTTTKATTSTSTTTVPHTTSAVTSTSSSDSSTPLTTSSITSSSSTSTSTVPSTTSTSTVADTSTIPHTSTAGTSTTVPLSSTTVTTTTQPTTTTVSSSTSSPTTTSSGQTDTTTLFSTSTAASTSSESTGTTTALTATSSTTSAPSSSTTSTTEASTTTEKDTTSTAPSAESVTTTATSTTPTETPVAISTTVSSTSTSTSMPMSTSTLQSTTTTGTTQLTTEQPTTTPATEPRTTSSVTSSSAEDTTTKLSTHVPLTTISTTGASTLADSTTESKTTEAKLHTTEMTSLMMSTTGRTADSTSLGTTSVGTTEAETSTVASTKASTTAGRTIGASTAETTSSAQSTTAAFSTAQTSLVAATSSAASTTPRTTTTPFVQTTSTTAEFSSSSSTWPVTSTVEASSTTTSVNPESSSAGSSTSVEPTSFTFSSTSTELPTTSSTISELHTTSLQPSDGTTEMEANLDSTTRLRSSSTALESEMTTPESTVVTAATSTAHSTTTAIDKASTMVISSNAMTSAATEMTTSGRTDGASTAESSTSVSKLTDTTSVAKSTSSGATSEASSTTPLEITGAYPTTSSHLHEDATTQTVINTVETTRKSTQEDMEASTLEQTDIPTTAAETSQRLTTVKLPTLHATSPASSMSTSEASTTVIATDGETSVKSTTASIRATEALTPELVSSSTTLVAESPTSASTASTQSLSYEASTSQIAASSIAATTSMFLSTDLTARTTVAPVLISTTSTTESVISFDLSTTSRAASSPSSTTTSTEDSFVSTSIANHSTETASHQPTTAHFTTTAASVAASSSSRNANIQATSDSRTTEATAASQMLKHTSTAETTIHGGDNTTSSVQSTSNRATDTSFSDRNLTSPGETTSIATAGSTIGPFDEPTTSMSTLRETSASSATRESSTLELSTRDPYMTSESMRSSSALPTESASTASTTNIGVGPLVTTTRASPADPTVEQSTSPTDMAATFENTRTSTNPTTMASSTGQPIQQYARTTSVSSTEETRVTAEPTTVRQTAEQSTADEAAQMQVNWRSTRIPVESSTKEPMASQTVTSGGILAYDMESSSVSSELYDRNLITSTSMDGDGMNFKSEPSLKTDPITSQDPLSTSSVLPDQPEFTQWKVTTLRPDEAAVTYTKPTQPIQMETVAAAGEPNPTTAPKAIDVPSSEPSLATDPPVTKLLVDIKPPENNSLEAMVDLLSKVSSQPQADIMEKLGIGNMTDDLAKMTTLSAALPYLMAELPASVKAGLGYDNVHELMLLCTFKLKNCLEEMHAWYSNSIGNCFSFNHIERPEKILDKSGPRQGLRIYFNTLQNTYMPTVQAAGVMVVISDRGEPILPSIESRIAPPGLVTSIAQDYYEERKAIRCFNETYNIGQASNERYSIDACLQNCFQNLAFKQCGCIDPSQDINASVAAPLCGLKQKACVDKLTANWSSNKASCGCKDACSGRYYHTVETHLKLWTRGGYFSNPNSVTSKSAAGVGVVEVYSHEWRYVVHTQTLIPSLEDFFSDMVNQIGLWLGFGVVSLVEVAILPYYIWRKKTGRVG